MATPKKPTTPASSNTQDWETLLEGTGDAMIFSIGEAAQAIMHASEEIGAEYANVARAASGISILQKAEEAYLSIQRNGVNLPDDLLLSAAGLDGFKPTNKDEKALAATYKKIDKFVELGMVEPAVRKWVHEHDKIVPGFAEWAVKTRKECEAGPDDFKNARQQADNKRMEIKRAIMFGPVLPTMKRAAEKNPKVFAYGGAAGFRKLAAWAREKVKRLMIEGGPVSVPDVNDKILQEGARLADKPEVAEYDDAIQAAFDKVANAVSNFSKFLKDAKDAEGKAGHGVDQRHLDVWAQIRGELDGLTDFPFARVNETKLVKRDATPEEKAAAEKAELEAKAAALNEADKAEQAE
jgi:hypothetical protein